MIAGHRKNYFMKIIALAKEKRKGEKKERKVSRETYLRPSKQFDKIMKQ